MYKYNNFFNFFKWGLVNGGGFGQLPLLPSPWAGPTVIRAMSKSEHLNEAIYLCTLGWALNGCIHWLDLGSDQRLLTSWFFNELSFDL